MSWSLSQYAWKWEDNIKVGFKLIDIDAVHLYELAKYLIQMCACVFEMLRP
jgi:hypothetical protein